MPSGRSWLRLDALGILTIVVYGTWFYGFGVLFEDLTVVHRVSSGTLGLTYGAANLLAGAGAIATGRRLDTIGPRAVLGIIGPIGACIYAASANFSGTTFLIAYALGGGVMGACGFYSFTQPLAVRTVDSDAARAITRLTIWGALSSPIMIPLTEALRTRFGWESAIRFPALVTSIVFVTCAAICVPRTASAPAKEKLGGTLRMAARDWRLRRFTLAAFLSGIAASTLLVYQVPTMTWAGTTSSVAAGFASARGLMQLAGRLPLVPAMKRFGAPRLMITARALLGVGALLLLGSGQWAIAIIYVAIAGITIGALSALDGVVARSVIGSENFGAVMGGVGLLSTLGGSIGPILAGQLRDAFNTPAASMVLVTVSAWSATVVFASLRLPARAATN